LIINELVTNSLKYAFPPDRKSSDPPTVEVGLKALQDGSFVLTVRDNGVGFESLASVGSNTLGLQLVDTLARQLGGTMKREHSDGALVTVSFRSGDEQESLTA
jgi:two-component sensor histidine kinase